MKNNALYK
jgi:hypothetical protein